MFHLWWKENLIKHLKVSKYYEKDCLQNFLLLFLLLLTAKLVKNGHIQARIYVIFLKNALKQTWNSFNTKFRRQWQDRESVYQVMENLSFLCNLIGLILRQDSVKDVGAKKMFTETIIHNIFQTNSSFHVK